MECEQADCHEEARFRYTWPGNDEAVACPAHAEQIKAVAQGIGLHLQMIPFGIVLPLPKVDDEVVT